MKEQKAPPVIRHHAPEAPATDELWPSLVAHAE